MGGLQSHIFLDAHLAEPRLEKPFAQGQLAFFSTARPDEPSRTNEDSALVLANDRSGLLVVADGAGGQPSGDKASELAVQSMRHTVKAAMESGESLRNAVLNGFERANRAVLDLGVGAGTTLVVVTIEDDRLRSYHVGDSAAFVVGQRGRLKLQTMHHSPVGYAVQAGVLDPGDALHHEDLSVVSNLVGTQDMRIEIGPEFRLSERDTVVLASDGVFDNFHAQQVAEVVRAGSLDKVALKLRSACLEAMNSPKEGQPSKPDDLTFILYRRN
jgi:serine/threonine protein phosphatase PrpC